MCHSFRAMVAQARRRDDLYFAALLPEDLIMRAFGAARARWQGWVYTPAVTVWVFLSQCFSPDHSCREAVARLMAWRLTQGLSPCSLLRNVMAAAAHESGRSPWEISFKGTLQTLDQFLPTLVSQVSSEAWCDALLAAVATHIVGHRPDRFEPRLRKRRPKPYKHLREPRRNYKPCQGK